MITIINGSIIYITKIALKEKSKDLSKFSINIVKNMFNLL